MKTNQTSYLLTALFFYTVLTYSTIFFYTESSTNPSTNAAELQTREDNLKNMPLSSLRQRKVKLQPIKRVQRQQLLKESSEEENNLA